MKLEAKIKELEAELREINEYKDVSFNYENYQIKKSLRRKINEYKELLD